MVDVRLPEEPDEDVSEPLVLQTNKKHQAGVTYIKEIDENLILTGSYDCFLRLWDARKIN